MMKYRILIALAIATLSLVASAQDGSRLPDLGSSAGTLRSPEQNRRIGASVLRQIRAANLLLDDPLLRQYINGLGYRLVANSEVDDSVEFTFFVMRDDDINAFAMPGGFVAINAGLLAATQSESELAGVLAHEIAHVTQHHMLRAAENSKIMSPLIALGMLGALVAASQGGNGQAVPAILAGGTGFMAQNQISFTRKDEIEADRVGIDTLAASGFDPDGMAEFFGRMQRLLRPGSGGINPPQLLLTHPVAASRISDAKARANALKMEQRERAEHVVMGKQVAWTETVAPVPYLAPGTSLLAGNPSAQSPRSAQQSPDDYLLMRERTRVLSSTDADSIARYYAENMANSTTFETPATRYGYALALTRNGKPSKAIDLLKPMLAAEPGNLVLRLAMADAHLEAGQRAQSLQAYAEMLSAAPGNHAVALAYADALLQNGKADDAERAAAVLKPLLNEEVEEPELYRSYGRASALSGHEVRAAEAFADATYLSGHPADAMNQLQRVLERDDLSYYQRARIEARVEFITPIVLEMRRRGTLPEQRKQVHWTAHGCDGRAICGIPQAVPTFVP